MPDSTPVSASSPVTQQQAEILHLFYQRGWTMWKISQFLRVPQRTCEREKARALDALRSTDEEMKTKVAQKEGMVRFTVSIEQASEVQNRVDNTASDAAKVLTVPGFRQAYYQRDRTPEEVIAARAKVERFAVEKPAKPAKKKFSRRT